MLYASRPELRVITSWWGSLTVVMVHILPFMHSLWWGRSSTWHRWAPPHRSRRPCMPHRCRCLRRRSPGMYRHLCWPRRTGSTTCTYGSKPTTCWPSPLRLTCPVVDGSLCWGKWGFHSANQGMWISKPGALWSPRRPGLDTWSIPSLWWVAPVASWRTCSCSPSWSTFTDPRICSMVHLWAGRRRSPSLYMGRTCSICYSARGLGGPVCLWGRLKVALISCIQYRPPPAPF